MKRLAPTALLVTICVLAPLLAQARELVLLSPAVEEGGTLPKEFTGDGDAATLPLEWKGAPAATRSYAVIMHHVAPDMTKWYWVLYNIPADVTRLPKDARGIGTLGNNSVNRKVGYAPPHSKGPGPKKYTYTVYALSAPSKIAMPPGEVGREVLLTAIKDRVLATAELNVIYSRGTPPAAGKSDNYLLPPGLAAYGPLSLVLGRASDRSVTISALARETLEGYYQYGPAPDNYDRKTGVFVLRGGKPVETVIDDLQADRQYFYRLYYRKPGENGFRARSENRFHTQRTEGSVFTFSVQGDSHPERPRMNDPELYARTLSHAASGHPDFYICLGDDFSVDTLRTITADTVAERYALQRPFLGLVAQSAPLFLVNGNHEQASLFNYNQPDIRHDAAVWAQTARNLYYPMPAPDGFYTGDAEPLKSIGPLRDYYAWTWGDALFVVLDSYWHSPAQVDNEFHQGGGKTDREGHKDRDWWGITLGDAQYRWFERTLARSKAKYKFVFAHHVMGSGRGGIDEAGLYEWGGMDKRGDNEFRQRRPGWELPIHQLMVRHGVTIFFQGHDHLFARQERGGVVYQEVPMPADPGYACYNEDRYASGVKLPNTGYLRVTVSAEQVNVDYVRCYLPKDEAAARKTGKVAYHYTVRGKK